MCLQNLKPQPHQINFLGYVNTIVPVTLGTKFTAFTVFLDSESTVIYAVLGMLQEVFFSVQKAQKHCKLHCPGLWHTQKDIIYFLRVIIIKNDVCIEMYVMYMIYIM